MQLVTEIFRGEQEEPSFRIFTLGRDTAVLMWDTTDSMKASCRRFLELPDGYRMVFAGNNQSRADELLQHIKASGISTKTPMFFKKKNDDA